MTITLTREEAQQVLDALERGRSQIIGVLVQQDQDAAIKTLRARLSAPEPEPVAWVHRQGNYTEPHFRQLNDDEIERGWTQEPLYATECMPDDLIATYEKGFADGKAKREWQGLTDEEAEQIVDDYWHDVDMFIEAIEAKLREKNL